MGSKPSNSTSVQELIPVPAELQRSQLRDESIMLAIRMRSGLPLQLLDEAAIERLSQYQSSGHINEVAGSIQLTGKGRLIADRLVREALG